MTAFAQDSFAVFLASLAEGNEANFRPARLADPPGWLGHAPFAHWLVRVASPRLVVELGVHSGNSYCAFAQSVAELGLQTTCLGVDTWQGDAQAGFYDESVLADLAAHHDPRYGRFSRLVRSSFDQALPLVDDASVDILHIDGFHAYEAVSHDFATWRPKLSPRGVVLLHDVCEIREDFGVARFWKELRATFSGFVFAHNHGLGVLLAGEAPPPALAALAAQDAAPGGDWARAHFARLGQVVVQTFELKQSESALDALASDLENERKRREDLDQSLDRANRRHEALRLMHDQALARGLDLESDLVRLDRELAEADRQARTLGQSLEQSANQVRDLLVERQEFVRTLGQAKNVERRLRARAKALQDDLEQTSRLAQERLEALNQVQAQARDLRAEHVRLGYQVRACRDSLSWRITAPLRRLGQILRPAPRLADREREARAIRKSGLFDQAFYQSHNPDVAASGQDPALHYVTHGWREGRVPSPVFDQAFYRGRHPEARDSGVSPLCHYLAHDKIPGHDPNPLFDTAFYLKLNPDVAEAKVNPLVHYLNHGASEGRDPHPGFVTRFALLANPELARSGENPLAWSLRHDQSRRITPDPTRLAELSRPTAVALDWQREQGPLLRPRIAFAVFLDARGHRQPQAVQAAESVLDQTYPFWRLVLLAQPDASPNLPDALTRDPRVEIHQGAFSTQATAVFLARAAEYARADHHSDFGADFGADNGPDVRPWAVCLAPNRRLEPQAFFELARAAASRPELVLLTADDLAEGPDGRFTPRLKYGLPPLPDAKTVPVDECLALSGQALSQSGACPWLTGPRRARDFFATLDLTPKQAASLPLILSRVAKSDQEAPETGQEPPLSRPASVSSESAFDLASVIIPTAGKTIDANLAPCLASLATRQTGAAFELVIVDNSPEGLPRKELSRLVPAGARLNVVRDDGPFNFPRLVNAGVRAARGSLLVLLNDDVKAACDGWLASLTALAATPGCAVAGAKLLYPNGRVQHAGMFHTRQGFRHAFRHAQDDPTGTPLLGQARRVSAVTFACAAIPRAVWERLDGLDTDYAVECNDTDFCLRAAQAGLFVAWTPHAVLVHKESASRRGVPVSKDRALLRRAWADVLALPDPYHHRHLSPRATQPRSTSAPVFTERHAPGMTIEDASALGLDAQPGAGEPRTILAMDLGHLGDLVLALPALVALRRAFPRARLTLACSPANLELARRLCDVDEVVAQPLFHARSEEGLLPGRGPNGAPPLAEPLAGRRFDLAVDLRRHPESRPLLGRIDAHRRAGYDTGSLGHDLDISLPLTDRVVDRAGQEDKLHAAAQKFALALACAPPIKRGDLVVDDCLPALASRLDRRQALDRFGLPEGQPLVGLHPGSGSSMRRWPVAAWAELADRLAREKNARILLLGAPDEAELAERVLGLCSRTDQMINLTGRLALDDFCDLLPHLDAFVGNNSGPCHLAGIAGVATITPWSGQVSAREWLAMGPRTQCVRAATPCSPCYLSLREHCPFDRLCLRLVSPAAVFEALEGLLVLDTPAASPPRQSDFDARAYLAANPDVAASGLDPLTHYRLHGLAEGRPLRPAPSRERPESASAKTVVQVENRNPTIGNLLLADPQSFALSLAKHTTTPHVCVVSHDASRTGAPLIALEILKRLARRPEIHVCALLLGPGELADEFAQAAPTLLAPGLNARSDLRRTLSAAFSAVRPALCLANTAASARCALALCDLGLPVMSLVHEMPESIETLVGRGDFAELVRRCRPVVLPSRTAASAIALRFGLDMRKFPVVPSGSFRPVAPPEAVARNRRRIRRELELQESDFLVLGCASLDLRKGADLFARLPTLTTGGRPMRFAWVGDDTSPLAEWLKRDALALGFSDRLRFVGAVDDPTPYLHAANALALTSREDPFPLAALEAMGAGLPVVAFDQSGGAPEALSDCGLTVPFLDVAAMAQALLRLADDSGLAADLGERAAKRAAERFTFDRYMTDLIRLMDEHHGLGL